MVETPEKTFGVPPPLPASPGQSVDDLVTARKSLVDATLPPVLSQTAQTLPRTDKVAIASSICGLTAFIPVFSQLVGLFLGIWAFVRIGRARRAGKNVRGVGWALAGVTGNAFALLGWVSLFATFSALHGTLNQATNQLHPLVAKPAIPHLRVRK
jgi:hypothetical protein